MRTAHVPAGHMAEMSCYLRFPSTAKVVPYYRTPVGVRCVVRANRGDGSLTPTFCVDASAGHTLLHDE